MEITEHKTFTGESYKKYVLDITDLNYLKHEFNIQKTLNGFYLESKYNSKLSISINKFGILYDKDISARDLMIARERVEIKVNILNSNNINEYKKYLPVTSKQLEKIIDTFKYKTVDKNIISNFK